MLPRSVLSLVLIGFLTTIADAALLQVEFAGGGSEVTMAPSDTVQINIVWTMHATDTAKNTLSGVDLRFNVNDVPDPDGTDRPGKYVVESVSTPIAGWTTEVTWGVGEEFSYDNFFLSAIDPDLPANGVTGNGTDFSTIVASFVLHKADFEAGETYITFHVFADQFAIPGAYDGAANWPLRWQSEITGPGQFDLGLGNPGDAGPQWDPYHGLETFQPLIIHNLPEPGGLGILVLAGLTVLRRRRRADDLGDCL